MKAFLFYCGTCTALLLLALAFKSLGDKQASFVLTGAMLVASGGIIGLICRQHK